MTLGYSFDQWEKGILLRRLSILVINVDEEGNVTEAKVQKGHSLLNDAAVAAMKQCKYTPTLLNGKPIR